jgi:hypothetical protein
MQIAGSWSGAWTKRRHQTERRNGTFGFRCYSILYAIEAVDVARIKFGVTSNIDKRFRQLCNGSPVELTLLGHVWMPDVAEAHVFDFLKDDRVHGEWFVKTERSRSIAALIAAKLGVQLAEVISMDQMIPEEMVTGWDGNPAPKGSSRAVSL